MARIPRKHGRHVGTDIANAKALLDGELGRVSPDLIMSRTVPLLDCLWRPYANEYILRRHAAETLSTLMVHDVVWNEVRQNALKYVAMLRDYDASPFGPSPITVIQDGPYREGAVAFLRELLEDSPGMAENDIRAALAGLSARAPLGARE